MATRAELQRENEAQRAPLALLVQQAASSAVQLERLIAANAALSAQVARLNDRVAAPLAVARRRPRPPAPTTTRGQAGA